MSMKIGDLVRVLGAAELGHLPGHHRAGFVSVITKVIPPEDQMNKMHMVQVLEAGMKKWYPVGLIKVISESR